MNLTVRTTIVLFGILNIAFIGGIIAFIVTKYRTKTTCNECGFKIKDKNTRQCPKCGNPLK